MNTNVKGSYFICKYAVQQFRAQGRGNIVNVSSDAGLQGNKELSLYCASKGAITIMSKALAIDLAPHNIRVNCVCPGDLLTPMLDADLQRESDPAAYLQGLTEPYPMWSVDGGITA